MKKLGFWRDEVQWENPIKSAPVKPYLADEIFPEDPRSAAFTESAELLKRFYCEERSTYRSDLGKLNAYLASPNEQLFLIEGDVGIGKTWFIRYHLTVARETVSKACHAGVIDLLRAGPDNAEFTVYRQICPLLETYFATFFGAPAVALQRYAEEQYRGRLGPKDITKIRGGASTAVTRWLSLDYGAEYAHHLMAALEHLNGPLLFIAIDNLDRISEGDQDRLVKLCQTILRNSRIRLIVPLRTTSPLLRDRFRGLHEVRHESMRLSALRLSAMLRPRFSLTREGSSLEDNPVIEDGQYRYTYPRIFSTFVDSSAGELVCQLAGSNCRVVLHMMKRLLESDQLKGVSNIANVQYVIAALMLADNSEPDESAPIINLLDNEELARAGNGLIRFRVLEYLYQEGSAKPTDRRFQSHFERLGYSRARLKNVLVRMTMASMIYSQKGFDPQALEQTDWDDIGLLAITETGRAYFDVLISQLWYYVAAKQCAAPRLPKTYVSKNESQGHYFVRDRDFVDYLREEEAQERGRAREWDRRGGMRMREVSLRSPHLMAKSALTREERIVAPFPKPDPDKAERTNG